MNPRIFAALISLLPVASARAAVACGDMTRASCRQERLQSIDDSINALYKSLQSSLSQPEARNLQLAQRAWMKQRDSACRISAAETQRKDWLTVLAADSIRSICVMGASEARAGELRDTRQMPVTTDGSLEVRRQVMFPVSRRAGKWYFEVEVMTGSYRNESAFELQIGVQTDTQFAGIQADRRALLREADSQSAYRVAMAVDFDNSKFYWAVNGVWQNAKPGSAGGGDLKSGMDYAIIVKSTGPSLSRSFDLGFIVVNTGNTAFTYALPPGFLPFYTQPAPVAAAAPDWVVPRYMKVQGKTHEQWAQAYWTWLMSRDAARSPVQDLTGAYCADGQAGPVWMLSGGDAAARIERSCTVRRGSYLLVPTVVQLIGSNIDAAACERLVRENFASNGAGAVQGAYLTVDGLRLDALEDHRIYSPACTAIVGQAGQVLVANAVFYGVWLLVRPLPPGDHVLQFGGELPALNLKRDVTYRIRVQ